METYRTGSHSVSRLSAHFVWVTKYRYHVLTGDVQVRCRDLVVQICNTENVQILKGVVSKDHVHIHVEYPPSLSISVLVKKLKGRTSRILQQEYRWDLMPQTTANEHVAKLLYHLGVSVNMSYGADGSGAYSHNVPYAIKTYFDYTSRAKIVSKSSYTDEDWRALLTSELLAGRPIYYSGNGNDGQAGHAFCLDGVNQNGLFHFNWGWSGSYNGYYSIGSLTPGSYNFSFNQDAVIYFEPRNHAPYDIQITNNKVYESKPAGEFVGKLVVSDETPNDSHTFEVHGTPGIDGEIGEVPFTVKTDSLVTTQVLHRNQVQLWEVVVKAIDLSGLSFEKSLLIEVVKQPTTDDVPATLINKLSAYTSANAIVIEFNDERPGEGSVNIVTVDGKIAKSIWFSKGYEKYRTDLNINDLQKGIYIMNVSYLGKKYSLKVFVP